MTSMRTLFLVLPLLAVGCGEKREVTLSDAASMRVLNAHGHAYPMGYKGTQRNAEETLTEAANDPDDVRDEVEALTKRIQEIREEAAEDAQQTRLTRRRPSMKSGVYADRVDQVQRERAFLLVCLRETGTSLTDQEKAWVAESTPRH